VPIILFFVAWQFAALSLPKGVIPLATGVFAAMGRAFLDGDLGWNTLISLQRIGIGFGLAMAFGIGFGYLLGTFFKPLERLFLPFFRLCEKVNPFAIIPVFMILFGIGTPAKVAIVFWAAVWPILFNTQEAAQSINPQFVRAARAMSANKRELFFKVIVPSTVPSIFTGLKIAIRVAFFMIIASEIFGAIGGLGWYYMQVNAVYKLNLVYGTILYITVLAILFNFAFGKLEQRFMIWKEDAFR